MVPNRRVMYNDSAFSIFFKFMRSWLVKALVSVKGARACAQHNERHLVIVLLCVLKLKVAENYFNKNGKCDGKVLRPNE